MIVFIIFVTFKVRYNIVSDKKETEHSLPSENNDASITYMCIYSCRNDFLLYLEIYSIGQYIIFQQP